MTGQSKNTNVQEYLGTAYHRKDVGWLVHVVNTEEKQTLKQSTQLHSEIVICKLEIVGKNGYL